MARKAHKINVFRFRGGNSGLREPIGFIWRHGEVLRYSGVPVFNGAATPVVESLNALVVQIAGKKRFVTDRDPAAEFVVTLCAWDRLPSGLYDACPHCEGKGYFKSPKTDDGFIEADIVACEQEIERLEDLNLDTRQAKRRLYRLNMGDRHPLNRGFGPGELVKAEREAQRREREIRDSVDDDRFESEHGPGGQS
jgi:hypothetical protein